MGSSELVKGAVVAEDVPVGLVCGAKRSCHLLGKHGAGKGLTFFVW